MALAPVRAASVLVGDRLDGAEVGLPLHALEGVDRDVDRLALVGRAEQRVVGRDEAHLDREVDRVALGGRLDRAHRVGGHRSRQGVLHLGEPDEAGVAKMRSERSTRVLVPDRRVTRRLSDGIARGNARPMTHASWTIQSLVR